MFKNLLSRDFLNERLVPELERDTVQYFDHRRRYIFAQQFVRGKRVLDIACGTGYGSQILWQGNAAQVISVDLSREALRYARQQWSGSRYVQGDALRFPLGANSMDVIVSFETLEHLAEPKVFLAEARRVLHDDGFLIVSTPNRLVASPGSDTPYSPYHSFEPTPDELRELMTAHDWHIAEAYSMAYSPQLAPLVGSATEAYARETAEVTAWSAYLRLAMRNALPPALMDWLGKRRNIPVLDAADSVLQRGMYDDAGYLLVVCQKAT